jgi:hypothetical protein
MGITEKTLKDIEAKMKVPISTPDHRVKGFQGLVLTLIAAIRELKDEIHPKLLLQCQTCNKFFAMEVYETVTMTHYTKATHCPGCGSKLS